MIIFGFSHQAILKSWQLWLRGCTFMKKLTTLITWVYFHEKTNEPKSNYPKYFATQNTKSYESIKEAGWVQKGHRARFWNITQSPCNLIRVAQFISHWKNVSDGSALDRSARLHLPPGTGYQSAPLVMPSGNSSVVIQLGSFTWSYILRWFLE